MKYGNIIYFGSLHVIGGIETWLYNLSQLYADRDVLVLVKQGTQSQIDRIAKNFRIKLWKGENYSCEKLFVCFNKEIISHVEADRKYLVLHGDYEDMVNRKQLTMANLPFDERIDEYIGVSQQVCDAWEHLTGIKATLCYNPVVVDEPRRTVRLLSAQRMSKEKGFDRIKALSYKLDDYCRKNNVSYMWDIYTDKERPFVTNNIYYKNPRLDIQKFYKAYDYFVLLSDNEGYCYSVVENLVQGVPCIVTDIPVFKELGLNDANSIKLDMNLANMDEVIMKIFNSNLKFDYTPPKDRWGDIFSEKESNYTYEGGNEMTHTVIALDTYQKHKIIDQTYGRIMYEGETFEVTDERLDILLGNNPYKVPFVRLVEEAKEEPKEEVAEEPVEEKAVEEKPVEEAPTPKKRKSKKNKE